MFLIEVEDHALVACLDLAQALKDGDYNVGYVLIFFESKPDNFLCAHHVKLINTALAHLALQVVLKALLGFGLLLLLCLLFRPSVLAECQFFHYLFKFGVEV